MAHRRCSPAARSELARASPSAQRLLLVIVDEVEPTRRFRTVIPIRALIPNAVTVLALCFGLTGVRFGIAGEWEKAVASIIVAGVLDGIDGRIARLLKGTSRFGAELDSLSDVTAFGVAPALIVYLWSLQYLPGIGWVFAMAHAVTCALRLARFNAGLGSDDPPVKRAGFLTGIPAPVGAGLTLSPMFVSFWLDPAFLNDPQIRAVIVASVVSIVAFLMASSLPTFSWGSARLRPGWRMAALLGVGLFAAALFSAPWMTLSLLSLAYAISVPLSLRSARRIRLRAAQRAASVAAPPSVAGRRTTILPPAETMVADHGTADHAATDHGAAH